MAGDPAVVTNHDLMYAYSDDVGLIWKNSNGTEAAQITTNPITPRTTGIITFNIPQGSGILNQESQAVHPDGSFHILNHQNGSWYHYWKT